jgi:hypothetical protein
VSTFCRLLLLLCLATVGCEGGPTSEWPRGVEDDGESTPTAPARDAGAAGSLDAGVPVNAGKPCSELDSGAGDAGTPPPDAGDAGCR